MPLTTKLKPWLKHHIRKLPMLEKAPRFLMAKSAQWKVKDFIKRQAFSHQADIDMPDLWWKS